MALRLREYAFHADYAHICKYADADENLIHIIHIYTNVYFDLLLRLRMLLNKILSFFKH